jgi:hypothetical protein
MLRTRTTTFVAAACAALALAVPAALAQPNTGNQSGGAAGVVAAVVQVQDVLNNPQILNNSNVEIVTVKDSLNNVLQNATFLNNITILQNFLNNNLNQANCTAIALCNSLTDFLNNNDVSVVIGQVVGINVLSGGLVVYVL